MLGLDYRGNPLWLPSQDSKSLGDRGLERVDFSINYLYHASNSSQFKPFNNGSILHSGDSYKLILEPSRAGYVYIFQFDSGNKIFQLFPTTEFKGAAVKNNNPVIRGERYFIPSENKSFELDNQTGKETLYLIFTKSRDAKLEAFYRKVKASDNSRQEWHQAMQKKRGPKIELVNDEETTITWNEEGDEFTVMSQYLKNMCVGCVHIVNFEHR
jgi:hypothetical protein